MKGLLEAAMRPKDEWVVREEQARERQLYWREGRLYAARDVERRSLRADLYCDRGGQRGAATAHLSGDDGDEARIRDGILAAELALNPPYRLPEGAAAYPAIPLGDGDNPDRAALEAWGRGIEASVRGEGSSLSTLEVFAARSASMLSASNGRSHRWEASHYAADVVLSRGEGDSAVELRLSPTARRLQDLVPAHRLESALRAVRDRMGASLPPSGRMAVVLPASEMAPLLAVLRAHTDAKLRYTGALRKAIGDALILCQGDPVTLRMNPLLPHAVESTPTDGSTVPAQARTLVEGGVLRAYHADPQFAAYLGIPATGPVGTLELPAGSHSLQDLVADGPVLEVVSFSSNMPDPVSGDFAAEIKIGYLHEGGRSIPVAQGSISGNLFEALGRCRLSREVESAQDYAGPAFIRFDRLQVAGA